VNRALLERRTKMLRLSLTGVPLRLVIDSLSKEYDVKEKLLYNDWERRNIWIPQVVQLNDPTLLHKLLEGAKAVLPKAWLLLEDSENEFVKLGALKLIKDTNLEVLEILQSIGAIEKKPSELNVLSVGLGFEADPELKKILLEEAERQRKERDQQPAAPPV